MSREDVFVYTAQCRVGVMTLVSSVLYRASPAATLALL
jgi:hypothetical protein